MKRIDEKNYLFWRKKYYTLLRQWGGYYKRSEKKKRLFIDKFDKLMLNYLSDFKAIIRGGGK